MTNKILEQRAAERGWRHDPNGGYWHPRDADGEVYETLEEIPGITEPSDPSPPARQHTPGPWTPAEPHSSGGLMIAMGDSDAYCVLHSPNEQADARLIAAAPETAAERDRLKTALQDIVALYMSDPADLETMDAGIAIANIAMGLPHLHERGVEPEPLKLRAINAELREAAQETLDHFDQFKPGELQKLGLDVVAEKFRAALRVDAPTRDPVRRLVEQIAQYTTYAWTSDEGYSDDQASDAISTLNDNIQAARAALGLSAIPETEIGEQEESPAPDCSNCGDVRGTGGGFCGACNGELPMPEGDA